MNKVMKYQIVKSIDYKWKDFKQILKNIQKDTREILNKSIHLCWEYQGFSSEYKQKYGKYPKTKEILNYSNLLRYCYDKLKNDYYKFNKQNYTCTIKKATDKWKNDLKDIITGKKLPPYYKENCPIDLHKNSILIIKENDDYYINLSLISNLYKKELNRKSGQFLVLIKVSDNTQKTILERILLGEYNISNSQLTYNDKKNKWFINLTYSFEPKKKELDKSNIMGIDMGIVYPIYFAFNNSFKRGKIEGGEIERFRKQIEKRKNQLYAQGKYCGNGRIGHGIKTRIKPIKFSSEKVSNFRNTTNHKYSRYIVDMAIKNNCGIIQMEDLTGINKNNAFLKNWTYYDLQQKIKYKAEEVGIEVKFIDPQYTSQRCSKCGYIHKDNRPEQKTFKCQSCGFETNADYNAARNIATQDIDLIIKEQIKN